MNQGATFCRMNQHERKFGFLWVMIHMPPLILSLFAFRLVVPGGKIQAKNGYASILPVNSHVLGRPFTAARLAEDILIIALSLLFLSFFLFFFFFYFFLFRFLMSSSWPQP